jgi:hypothetical protein
MSIFKSKFLLGVMVVAAMFAGVVAVKTAAAATSTCTITSTLKVGSKGAQVVCLQSALGIKADGNFGPMTKAAVEKWQANNSLVADGVFGAKSRAAFTGGVAVVPSCPVGSFNPLTGQPCGAATSFPAGCTSAAGFSPTTGTSCATSVPLSFPAGCTSAAGFSPTTGASCATGATGTTGLTNGTNGSLVASQSSAVSAGVTINAGATANLDAIKLQAVSGPVQVTSVDVHMNVRPWLYFSQLTLSSNGTVLATMPLTSANSTEITVGSDYLINFPGLNYTVTPGVNPDLVLAGTSISGTNRLPQQIDTVMTNIKTVNGSGWTDSVSPSVSAPTASNYGVGMNYVNLSSTGSNAEVYANLSNASPATSQVSVNQSVGSTTSGVTLGVFSLKSTNTSATINGMNIGLTYVPIGGAPNALSTFSNVQVVGPGCTSGCGGLLQAVSGNNYNIAFTNLTAPIAQDAWTDFTVKADVAGASAGTVYLTFTPATGFTTPATTTIGSVTTNNLVGTDSNYDALEFGTISAIQSNALTLTSSAVVLSNVSFANTGSTGGTTTTAYNTSLTFTLTNNGNNNIYVSTTPGETSGTSAIVNYSLGGGAAVSASSTVGTIVSTVTPSTEPQDSLTTSPLGYEIPINGSRTFTIYGVLIKGTTGGQATMTINGINYETTQGGLGTATVSNVLPVSIVGNF